MTLDKVRFRYYNELDYDEDYGNHLRKTNFEKVIQYWEPFNVHAVTRTLEEHRNCVFDFGAIHSVYEDQSRLIGQSISKAPPQ